MDIILAPKPEDKAYLIAFPRRAWLVPTCVLLIGVHPYLYPASTFTMIRFDTLPPEVVQAMCTPMHQILPAAPSPSPSGSSAATTGALYVGSISALSDKDYLLAHHITHLVQVLDAPWIPLSEKDGFNCYRIQILDASSVDLRPHLEAVCEHIEVALRSGRNVLIHCQQGVSRSPAIAIAYLIRNLGMTYDAAHALLKRKRACVKPNSGFVKALQEWEGICGRQRRPNNVRRFTT